MEEDYSDPWSAYSKCVEIFMALRNMDYYFDRRYNCLVRSGKGNYGRRIIVYLKPPGALRYVQKCQTETLFGDINPKFATKLYFSFEDRDASAIQLKFDIQFGSQGSPDVTGGPSNYDWRTEGHYGCVECTLDVLLSSGYKGLDLPVLYSDPVLAKKQNRCHFDLGRIFLRAEIMKPIDYSVLIKFGLKTNSSPSLRKCLRRRIYPYYFEMYKSNEEMYFQMENAYTLIYRSELIKHSGMEDECWNFFLLPVARVCNGDLGRVLKVEIYQANNPAGPKGFAMTTLRKMLIERELVIPVDELSGTLSKKICLFAPLCYEVPLPSLKVYISKGLIIRRIYAVDFSSSNWDVRLHTRCLHDIDAGRTPYEEAIIMASGAIIDVAQGDSVFYSFGSISMSSYVATFGQENHVRLLVNNYREALYGVKMTSDSTALESFEQCQSSCVGGSATTVLEVSNGARLAPLLQTILDFLSLRTDNFEYHVVFIFSDGNISDFDLSKHVITSLAKLPVSLVFIGIGRGDFRPLLILENSEWTDPETGEAPCRKIVNVIHFRSLLDWDSALRYSNYSSTPPDIFRKEILTVIRDQMPAFMRVARAAI